MNKKELNLHSFRYSASIKNECDKIRAKLPAGICPMPFISLIFNPDGNVSFCRERTSRDSIGNIKTQSVAEIWNGEKIRAIRREFLEGKIESCKCLIKNKHCNFQADNQVFLPLTDFSEFQKNPPLRISPDFNGRCNLKCIMCTIWQHPSGLYDEVGFWTTMKDDLVPHLRFVDFLAGEPFIQRDTYRWINLMHEMNPDCAWRFTTNANWRFNSTVKKYLDKIRNLYGLTISLDATSAATYQKIRRSSRFSMVLETVDAFIEYRSERVKEGGEREFFPIIAAMALQKDNWKEAPDFLRWCRKKGLHGELQPLFIPNHLSVFNFDSVEKRQEVVLFYIEKMDYSDLLQSFAFLIPLLETLPESIKQSLEDKIILEHLSNCLDSESIKSVEQCFPAWFDSFSSDRKLFFCKTILDNAFRNYSNSRLLLVKNIVLWLISQMNPADQRPYQKACIIYYS